MTLRATHLVRATRLIRATQLGIAATALLMVGAVAASAEPGPAGVEVAVRVPDGGALSISVAGATLDLGEATLAEDRTAWIAAGTLPTITVADTRVTDPGWNLSAQVSPFAQVAADGSTESDLPPVLAYLLLSPVAGTAGATGIELAESVELGESVPPEEGSVLAWTSAGSGLGHTEIGGAVEFRAPLETDAGAYRAVITLTVS